MPLTIHHMDRSQSERILFLLEELAVPYKLELHSRNPVTALAQDSLKAVHPTGTAPVMIDEEPNPNRSRVVLAESGAIVEYLVTTYGGGKLSLKPGDEGYGEYLEWLHYCNGTLQPAISRLMMLGRAGVEPDAMVFQFVKKKVDTGLQMMEKQLSTTGKFLAGDRLSAADIMHMFTLTTMRGFFPVELTAYPSILAYLRRMSEREGYKRAMAKGDPGLEPMIGAKVERFHFGEVKK